MKLWISVVVFVSAAMLCQAGGESEAAASATRGKYLAGRGVIVPPEEVYIDSFVAHIDYNYPYPEDAVGVNLYTGHRQISTTGQDEILQIGIQANDLPFEELTPLNLAFVIDKSGSMADRYKMDYVKKAFEIFIDSVRDKDFVALVVFDDRAEVLFPSTQMNSYPKRQEFRSVVQGIQPGGGTNLAAGLELGYEQVLSNYRSEYTNRVLFLTDGVGESTGVLDLADGYRQMGINVSTIGVGDSIDLELIRDLARRGGGSSRFISDVEEMEKIFGSELDRMAVPAARELRMRLEFLQPVQIVGTWGYNHAIQGNTITYSLPTLHHRDYETILVDFRTPDGVPPGPAALARFTLSYSDLQGREIRLEPLDVRIEYVEAEHPVSGISSGMVLRSGTTLRFAKNLKRIGEIYYEALEQVESGIEDRIRTCLDLSVSMRNELLNARMRLDEVGFEEEIEILDNYLRILGQDLEIQADEFAEITGDTEIAPSAPNRPLDRHLENLFREITLEMEGKGQGAIAVAGFITKSGEQPELITMLNEMGVVELSKMTQLRVVERERIDLALQEQELALSDLVDTTNAISVGRVLAAQYVLTGTLIEMPNSVVIFGRVVNVATTEIESAAQVIVPKSREVRSLL